MYNTIIDTKKVKKVLTKAKRFIDNKKNSLPILSYCLLSVKDNQLTISTTNLETFFSETITVRTINLDKMSHDALDNIEPEYKHDFSVAVKLDSFLSIIKTIIHPEFRIQYDLEENMFEIVVSPVISYQVNSMFVDEFPPPPTKDNNLFDINSIALRAALVFNIPFAAIIDNRPVLTALLFSNAGQKLSIASADGYRLGESLNKINNKTDDNFLLLPIAKQLKKVLQIIPKKDTVVNFGLSRGYWGGHYMLHIAFDNIEISTHLIDGKYPDFNAIIPRKLNMSKMTLNRQDFLLALQTIRELSDMNIVKIDFHKMNKVVILKHKSKVDSVENDIEQHCKTIDTETPDITDGFFWSGDADYLIDAVKNLDVEEIHVWNDGVTCPFLIEDEKQLYKIIVMPLVL